MTTLGILSTFRDKVYSLISKRKDATMELVDAVSSHGNKCGSVVELSEAPCFTRKYSSITDAISDGSLGSDFKKIQQLMFNTYDHDPKEPYRVFAMDATSHPRLHARKLIDRSIVHAANFTPGQKPITLGHEYSCIALLPQNKSDRAKNWLLPLSTDRVPSSDKPHEFGMIQFGELLKNLGLTEQLVVNVSDSAYGTKACRKTASESENLVHVFRMGSHRKVFLQPNVESSNHKKYGDKMLFSNTETHCAPDGEYTTQTTSKKGKKYLIKITRFNDVLLRGTTTFKGYENPIDLLKIIMHPINHNGDIEEPLKKPMWLSISGKRRREINAISVYEHYSQRFDLEHFFRFSKNKLLVTQYQTPEVENEESFWKLGIIAYSQLFFARNDAALHLKDWEKYSVNKTVTEVYSPTQVQRSFPVILDKTSTPALPAKPRWQHSGRSLGEKGPQRPTHPIIIKGPKPAIQKPQVKLLGFEKDEPSLNLQSLTKSMSSLSKQLQKFGLTAENFKESFENSQLAT